jgi:hypothetical protein
LYPRSSLFLDIIFSPSVTYVQKSHHLQVQQSTQANPRLRLLLRSFHLEGKLALIPLGTSSSAIAWLVIRQ